VSKALFDVLEVQNIVSGQARITLIPPNREMLGAILAGRTDPAATPPPIKAGGPGRASLRLISKAGLGWIHLA
jgi:hypothetical protein